ncbi:MAG: hypothetical protein PHX20_06195 [Candidatus Omnitrophica bacterium]|nr:hypothetical protein [Candidatus Omnitrophota bacterium]MDD5437118.1 hypothetical protein [Candidatus Omnitrophota bacterium]
MKKIIVTVLFLAAVYAAYTAVMRSPKASPALNPKISEVGDKIEVVKTSAINTIESFKEKIKETGKLSVKSGAPENDPPKGIILYLKHGGVVEGKLLEKTADSYTVDWKGSKYTIMASQVARVEAKGEKEVEWRYKNDVVVKRTNGIVSDGKITDIDNEGITLEFAEGGGTMEMKVGMGQVDHLMFAPVFNQESAEVEKHLKTLFPKLKFYREGNFTLITDSHPLWVNIYKKTIRSVYTEMYMKFFRLFKDRKPKYQNFVVIFDDPDDFAEYCTADCVPFWLILGYFSPTDKTLFLYNAFGEKWEKIVFEIAARVIGQYDAWIESLKAKYDIDKRYDIFIDGLVKENKDKFWNAYNFYKAGLSDITVSTLRHEFTHEILSSWGLQNIVLSKPKIDKEKLVAKKKEFLETKDLDKKKELFMTLMGMSKEEVKDIEMEASESWLAEGLATYFETEPPGSVDPNWLFLYQEMARKNEVNPIEFITNFKMGSFPGLCNKATLNAYAQSWAFATFLINTYPEQFVNYQNKVADKISDKEADKLNWLLECLNKDLPTLEKEFREFMKRYKEEEDPYVKRFMKYCEIYGK